MDEPSQNRVHRRKELNDIRRERDVQLLYGAAFSDIPHIEDSVKHVPRPSPDSTLTALCQLTAIRLGAQRCMISLLDGKRQHILAEATPDLDLVAPPDSGGPVSSVLWLGNVSLPRSWGVCEQLLDIDPSGDPFFICNDLTKDGRSYFREDVRANLHLHFYASAGLLSPNGTVVGSLCIFDNKARNGLPGNELSLLKSLASTVVAYLDTYTVKDRYRRGERFTRGLVSFAEGSTSLLPPKTEHHHGLSSSRPHLSSHPQPLLETPAGNNARSGPVGAAKDITDVQDDFKQTCTVPLHSPHKPQINRAESSRHQSISKLQETILPNNSKSMFTRAARLMMASSHLDGVIILDASLTANGQRRTTSDSEADKDATSESYHSRSSSSDDASSTGTGSNKRRASFSSSKSCGVLGVATSPSSETENHRPLLEPDLGRLLYEYPSGKIFTFSADGQNLSSTEEESGSSNAASENSGLAATPKRKIGHQIQRGFRAIHAMFPGARSVAFIPFWDYERSRWFAGCLCWSNDPCRLLSASSDLAYFKIFSHSIMREFSRLDAISMDEAKTAFVSSISHELRSPLHGILGTLEFVKDTPLDSFQTSMLNSLSACSTTLLDTINHVMDFSKLMSSTSKRKVSHRRLKDSNTICISSKPVKGSRNKEPAFDFGIATEEVIEAIFSGASYLPLTSRLIDDPSSPSDNSFTSTGVRKTCFIILDISSEDEWVYSFPVGSWRRIVMNLFGNAIKYTRSGFVHVSLRTNSLKGNTDAPTGIILTITDSGSGMSPSFLANRTFQPFSQENSYAPGTGLGLNIVRTIIDSSGGKIEIRSDPDIGTKLTVKLALAKPLIPNTCTAERELYLSLLPRFEGRRICILHKKIQTNIDGRATGLTEEGLLRFTTALAMTLQKHLKMEVVQMSEWEKNDADIVICPELSFSYLAAIRKKRTNTHNAPVTVFVAMDALEAATLRSDVRVTSRESVVEIMTQPCGPNKLAFVLNQCLERHGRAGENFQHSSPTYSLPEVDILSAREPKEPAVTLESFHISESVDAKPPTPPPSGRAFSAAGSNVTDRAATLLHQEEFPTSHILITDDNAINRKLLVAFMQKHSLQYEEATNGLEALQAYQAGAHRFDVILMDMSMPIMDGMSATRAIRAYERQHNLPRCSILALTGLTSASAKLEAWTSGIDHFMTKPVKFQELAALLQREEVLRQDRRSRNEKNSIRAVGDEGGDREGMPF